MQSSFQIQIGRFPALPELYLIFSPKLISFNFLMHVTYLDKLGNSWEQEGIANIKSLSSLVSLVAKIGRS